MNKKLFAITTGDINGIGFEITCKALLKLRSSNNFLIFCSPNSELKYIQKLKKKFNILLSTSIDEAFDCLPSMPRKKSILIFVIQNSSPAKWVEQSSELAMTKKISGLITAPMSKPVIHRNNPKDLGHTEILKRISKVKNNLFMCFIGSKFKILISTGHIPISKVSQEFKKKLVESLSFANQIANTFASNSFKKPIGVVGLNPHAGDSGLIGKDDFFIKKAVEKNHKNYPTEGPLVPDVVFSNNNFKKYSLILCQYHDQGLIPFKMAHGFDTGVHITIGLPFIRTSVDHGTAFDLFGKNCANFKSMKLAIDWCIKLSK